MRSQSVGLLVLAGALAGCAVKQPPPIQQAASEIIPESTRIPIDYVGAANAAKGEVTDGWLATFNDPVLSALVTEAIDNNLGLRSAVARLDQARALSTQASSQLKPSIVAGAQGNLREGFSSTDPSLSADGASLNLSWELDIWGRVRSQAAAGEAALDATQAQVEWAYQSVAAQTAKLYFLLTEARLQKDLAEEAVGLAEETARVTRSKYSVGQVTSREVSLAEARVAQTKAQVRSIESARQQLARGLEIMLTRYPAAAIEGATDLPASPGKVPAGLPAELLERRPDLIAAERRVDAEFFQIQSAEASKLPKIGLTAGIGTSSAELVDVVALGSDFWSAGANVLAPLYAGGALDAAVEIETAQQEQALADYGLAALRAFSEVEQSLANEGLLREQSDLQAQAVNAQDEALRVAQVQYEVGRVDLLSVLQQQAGVVSAQSQMLALRSQILQQRVDLHLALGGSFDAAGAVAPEGLSQSDG